MNPLNHNQYEGNFTKDPVISHTKRGRTVVRFTIAVDRFYREGQETKKETTFVETVAWDELGDKCGQMGRKGRGCRVTGRLHQENWNAPDGSLRSKLVIVAENIEYQSERKRAEEKKDEAE